VASALPSVLPAEAAHAEPPPTAAAQEPADSSAWIPVPPEELEATDRLEDRDPAPGLGARVDSHGGAMELRRLWLRVSPSPADAEIAWLARPAGGSWSTVRLQHSGRPVVLAAGAVVVRRPPVLLGEALGLVRPLRAVLMPRLEAPEFEPPRGPTSLVIRGAAASVEAASIAGWGAVGRGDAGEALAAGGLAVGHGGARLALAGGRGAGGTRAASIAGRMGGDGGEIRAEALLSPTRGPAILAGASRRAPPFEVSARWRRRSGEARPVAAELAVEGVSGGVRTRFSWRPWSARATEDDGRAELETALRRAGMGLLRVRIGARGGGAAERYVIGDAVVARERGRSFTVIASRRESRRAEGRSAGSALGGRLDLSARGRAGASLLLQASRAGGGAPAWEAALAPSGEDALTARGRSGVVVAGRAWLKVGPLRLEGLLSDAKTSAGDSPPRGTLRLEWRGGD